jgi:hypothetical protein
VHVTGWSRCLDVTGGGTGVVSHAGLVLLRELADRAGLTAGLSAALPSPAGGHDRGRVFADLACAVADGARVICDFRVMAVDRPAGGLRAGRVGPDRVAGAEGGRGHSPGSSHVRPALGRAGAAARWAVPGRRAGVRRVSVGHRPRGPREGVRARHSRGDPGAGRGWRIVSYQQTQLSGQHGCSTPDSCTLTFDT